MKTEGLGARMKWYRLERGLTQNDLAKELGVTPQAVSKWETGQGYPDVTLLPNIARVLDTSIDQLFGMNKAKDEPSPQDEDVVETLSLPEHLGNLDYVCAAGDYALYSSVPYKEITPQHVLFEDGSDADLIENQVTNRGKGEIRFIPKLVAMELEGEDILALDKPSPEERDELERALEEATQQEEDAICNIVMECWDYTDIHLMSKPSLEKNFVCEMKGKIPLKIRQDGDTLYIKVGHEQGNRGLSQWLLGITKTQEMWIYLKKEALDSLKINILGTGNFETDLPIKELEQEINGTGDGRYTQVSSCHATLNGTGDLHIQEVGDLRLKLNGTSDLIVEEIKGDLQAEVNGIGDVILRSGHIPNAKLRFVGPGDLRGRGVTVGDLDCQIIGPSTVTLGRVTGISREQVEFVGNLIINERE